jgi:hypothetical protein
MKFTAKAAVSLVFLALLFCSFASAQTRPVARPRIAAPITAPQASTTHSVTLTWLWSQGTGDPATGFHVWRAATCAALSTTGTAYATITPATTLTDVDTAVTAGQAYCYMVTAYDATGDSASTNEVSVTIPLAVPVAPTGLTVTAQ